MMKGLQFRSVGKKIRLARKAQLTEEERQMLWSRISDHIDTSEARAELKDRQSSGASQSVQKWSWRAFLASYVFASKRTPLVK